MVLSISIPTYPLIFSQKNINVPVGKAHICKAIWILRVGIYNSYIPHNPDSVWNLTNTPHDRNQYTATFQKGTEQIKTKPNKNE